MAQGTSVVERAKEWLRTEGYPFEFQCADVCRKAGLNTRVGVSLAREGEKPRDIDVLATHSPDDSTGHRVVMAQIAIECKYAKDGQAWIVLCQEELGFTADWTAKATLSEHAFMGLWTVPVVDQLTVDWVQLRSTLILSTDVVGSSVVQPVVGKQGNSGIPFTAMQKAVDSALTCVEYAASTFKRLESIKPEAFVPILTFVLPCVVIKGPIVAAKYDPDKGEMNCEEVRSARVDTQAGKSVYLLNADSFPEFVERAKASLMGFCEAAMRIDLQSLRTVRDSLRK